MKKIISVFFIIFCSLNISYSQTWSPLGSGFSGGGSSDSPLVYALTVFNNELIAGGLFNIAGGVNAEGIAKWNGATWVSFGSNDLTGYASCFTIFNNELIVGGSIPNIGVLYTNCIAKWNGTSWSTLGTGVSSYVSASFVNSLTVYNNELIVGGKFTYAGVVTVNNIAKWNGTTWSPLGSGIGGLGLATTVSALTVYNNELIAGGNFLTAGGDSVQCIAKWNGTSWSPLGSGLGTVYCLTVFNNELIAGGMFTTAGGVAVNNIAKWNDTSWSPLGSGITGTGAERWVGALAIFNNELIAGGAFLYAGGVSANRIAKWNGTSWSPLGSGLVGTNCGTGYYPNVRSLTIYNNKLIAGGNFLTAGGVSVNHIAKWGTGIGIKQISRNVPAKFSLSQNYPNPFNPTTNIRYQISKLSSPHALSGDLVTLKVYNVLGKEIATLLNEKQSPGTYEVTWDASNFPSGVYFYRLTAGDYSDTKRMILIK